jgi:hypothetical protein
MENRPPTPAQNVLCIEACDLILIWVVPLIEKLGCHVLPACDLTTAGTIIQQSTPIDLVLLGDLVRPDQIVSNAPSAELTLLIKLRSTPAYKRIPTIVFTSKDWLITRLDGIERKPSPSVREMGFLKIKDRMPLLKWHINLSKTMIAG